MTDIEAQPELDLSKSENVKCNNVTLYEELLYLRAKVKRLEEELEVERQKKT